MNYAKNNVTRRNFRAACDIATMLNNQPTDTTIQYITLRYGSVERTINPNELEIWSPACIYNETSYFGGDGELIVTVVRYDCDLTAYDREQHNYIWEPGYGCCKMNFETINYN